MTNKILGQNEKVLNVLILLAALGLLIVIVLSAWMCDDAYITYRTIDNWVNGYGLTWNVTERVQSYTHPLWMIILSGLYFFTHEIFYTSLAFSILLVLMAVYLMLRYLANGKVTILFLLLAMLSSKPFVDFATSGLENPLSSFLIVLFITLLVKERRNNSLSFYLALIASLAATTRADTILLYAPTLIFLLVRDFNWRNILKMAVGFLPFIIWEIFALFYYGFAVPNTAFAKLSTGIASSDLIDQGLLYLRTGFESSPITAVALLIAIVVSFKHGNRRLIPVSIGVLLYLAFVVRVGGDFMDGRMLTLPLVAALSLAARYRLEWRFRESTIIALTVIALALFWPRAPLRVDLKYGQGKEATWWKNGIADERAGYFQMTSLWLQPDTGLVPCHPWSYQGLIDGRSDRKVIRRGGTGCYGYYAGPSLHILDKHGLTDALISRLPIDTPKKWRVGHYTRQTPDGYQETLESGENKLKSPLLAEYYDKLCVIIKGDLFSFERLKLIAEMNLGMYDHILEQYINQPYEISYRDCSNRVEEGTAYYQGIVVRTPGLDVSFDSIAKSDSIEVSLDCNDVYYLDYFSGGRMIAADTIEARRIPQGGLRLEIRAVPKLARGGFDRLGIRPEGGDGTYSIGHVYLINQADSLE